MRSNASCYSGSPRLQTNGSGWSTSRRQKSSSWIQRCEIIYEALVLVNANNCRGPAPVRVQICSEATTGFEPVMEVLQTSALPLGHVAMQLREIACRSAGRSRDGLERAMGFEPTTFSLARRRSTTELHPRAVEDTVKEWASQALCKLADSS